MTKVIYKYNNLNIKTDYLLGSLEERDQIKDTDDKLNYCVHFEERKNDGRPTWIMQHHTVATYEAAQKIFLKGEVSIHFLIAVDGEIQQMVSTNHRAHHAGLGNLKFGSKINPIIPEDILKDDMNNWSVGIENANNGWEPFTEEQINANIHLLEYLVNIIGIDPKNIIAHSEWAPNRKIDPNPYFPWAQLAKASNLEGIDHNFGVYSFADRKSDPEILIGYNKPNSQTDIEELQHKLEELGYKILLPNNSNLGLYDLTTKACSAAFNRRYVSEDIIGNQINLDLWRLTEEHPGSNEAGFQMLSSWTENSDLVLGEVLDSY